jgi:hypothetical protein
MDFLGFDDNNKLMFSGITDQTVNIVSAMPTPSMTSTITPTPSITPSITPSATPTGASPPAFLTNDGHTMGWFKYDAAATITYSSGVLVSTWADSLGSGHDLVQATTTYQPDWDSVSGITFDGGDEFLKTAYISNDVVSPMHVYLVMKQISWGEIHFIFDGNDNNSFTITQFTPSPTIAGFNGTWQDPPSSDLAVGDWGIVRVLFSGVTSHMTVDGHDQITCNMGNGTTIINGWTLGSEANGTNPSNISVKELIVRNIGDTASDETDIYNYLKAKYSL